MYLMKEGFSGAISRFLAKGLTMKAVFLGAELSEKYPETVGCFISEGEDCGWINLADLIAALYCGESVEIRPATEVELANIEANAVRFDMGSKLGEAYLSLLNHGGRDYAINTVINTIALMDIASEAEELAPEGQS